MFRDRSTMQAMGIASELGFALACPLIACVGGGYWADGQLGTKPLLVLAGIVGGMVVAFGTLYNLTKMSFSPPRKAASGSAASSQADAPTPPRLTLEGSRPGGTVPARLNQAVDDLLVQLERVGDAESLAQARTLRLALAPERPDLERLLVIQQYFATAPLLVRDAADHFFADPVVTEILNTIS